MTPGTRLADRFWPKVRKTSRCWVWIARKDQHGYGRFSVAGSSAFAHRVSYEMLVGPIPAGLELDHLCRNTSCVNPGHLEPVTHRENMLRGTTPAARNARKTHCKHGHEFTPENTYVRRNGWRQCWTCKRASHG